MHACMYIHIPFNTAENTVSIIYTHSDIHIHLDHIINENTII